MSYSVILPTLNEKNHIIDLVKKISKIFIKHKKKYEIIIVDDNSTDGTIQTVKNFRKKKDYLKLLVRRTKKKNLAESLNDGIKKSKYNYVIWLDADFQHPPIYIKNFIKESFSSDVIVCSRFLQKSKRYFDIDKKFKEKNENQSILFNYICNKFIFSDLTDFTSGYICLKKKLIKKYNLNGYYGDYFLNLLCYLKIKKIKIKEIPFVDALRASGKSKTLVNLNLKYIYMCFNYFIAFIRNFLIVLVRT